MLILTILESLVNKFTSIILISYNLNLGQIYPKLNVNLKSESHLITFVVVHLCFVIITNCGVHLQIDLVENNIGSINFTVLVTNIVTVTI